MTTPEATSSAKENSKALAQYAKKDPVFKAVCNILMHRERPRFNLTVSALKHTLGTEGFYFSKAEYIPLMEFLASQGIGTLEKARGKVIGITDIRYTLQSIGKAGISGGELEPYRIPKHITAKGSVVEQAVDTSFVAKGATTTSKPLESKGPTVESKRSFRFITAVVNGTTLTIPLNNKISAEDIGNMILELHNESV